MVCFAAMWHEAMKSRKEETGQWKSCEAMKMGMNELPLPGDTGTSCEGRAESVEGNSCRVVCDDNY